MKKTFFILLATFCLTSVSAVASTVDSLSSVEKFQQILYSDTDFESSQLNLENTKASDWIQKGIEAHQEGDYRQAINDFTAAIELDSESLIAYRYRGDSLYASKKYDAAIANYTYIIDSAPAQERDISANSSDSTLSSEKSHFLANTYQMRGNSYFQQNDYSTAIEDFEQAILLEPKFFPAFYNRGLSYQHLFEYDLALSDFTQVIELNPKSSAAYNNRGLIYYKQKNYYKAILEFNRAITLDPKVPDFYTNRGISYRMVQDLQSAFSDFDQAILLDVQSEFAYLSRGDLFLQSSQYGKAIKDYSKAIQLNPTNSGAYLNRAYGYSQTREIPKALDSYRKFIQYADPITEQDKIPQVNKIITELEALPFSK